MLDSSINAPTTSTSSISFTPLGQIALSISGGGFRAAAFGLGCLSYLNQCQIDTDSGQKSTLLERVHFIASASGGSFVSLLYAKYLYEGKSFKEMYKCLRDFMDGETLLKQAMDILNDECKWHHSNNHKQRNLINAFSLAYDALFEGKTLGLFCDPKHHTTLNQICINSTEFRNGISFRFQNIDSKSRRGLIGNFGMYLRPKQLDIIQKLKLGDIMAASSCFPAGMEPIMFPRDFAYKGSNKEQSLTQQELRKAVYCPDAIAEAAILTAQEAPSIKRISDTDLSVVAEAQNEKRKTTQAKNEVPSVPDSFSFGLMDGGIDDNQGVKSLMLADKRFRAQNKGKGYDTFIICDVNSRYMAPYELPNELHGGLNSYSIRKVSIWVAIILVSLAGSIWQIMPASVWRAGIIGGILTLLLLEVSLLGWGWYKLRMAGGGTWARVWHRYNGYFFKIPIGSLKQMITSRIDSVVLLAGDVMMKQIRRIIFEQFYDNDEWEKRRISAFLYDLTSRNLPLTKIRQKRATGGSGPQPSEELQKVADVSSDMDTTLWFNGPDQDNKVRDKIIATGQFTMCYNLLRYLEQLKKAHLPREQRRSLHELEKRLITDWEMFQKDPEWLV